MAAVHALKKIEHENSYAVPRRTFKEIFGELKAQDRVIFLDRAGAAEERLQIRTRLNRYAQEHKSNVLHFDAKEFNTKALVSDLSDLPGETLLHPVGDTDMSDIRRIRYRLANLQKTLHIVIYQGDRLSEQDCELINALRGHIVRHSYKAYIVIVGEFLGLVGSESGSVLRLDHMFCMYEQVPKIEKATSKPTASQDIVWLISAAAAAIFGLAFLALR